MYTYSMHFAFKITFSNPHNPWFRSIDPRCKALAGVLNFAFIVGPVMTPLPAQLQVRYPIIDELADEFALLIAAVDRELCLLPQDRLQELKTSIEKKLKSKGTPITMPSSAEELIITISQFWDFLNFEFAQFVVRYIGIEELQARMQRYEEDLRRGAEVLLMHCRENNITPRAPPGCNSMTITMGVDPLSFSLYRILEIKDFLVIRIGMNTALFAGWSDGSITLHFYFLEDDMEMVAYLLKGHELELRNMQVVAIEVGGVIVYKDAPREHHSPEAGRLTPHQFAAIADAIKIGESVASKLQGLSEAVVIALDEMVTLHQQFDNEEIKDIPSVKPAQHDLRVFAEAAYAFLNKVDDIFHCCQSNLMAAAIQGLSCSPPDLKPTCDFMSQLRHSLEEAEVKYLELLEACDKASSSCREVAEVCGHKERGSQIWKERTKRYGGTAAGGLMVGGTAVATGGAVVGGMAALAIIGVLTLGTGVIAGLGMTAVLSTVGGIAGAAAGVGAALKTHRVASDYAMSEAAFRRIRGDFEELSGFANEVSKVAAQVHTMQENVAAQVDDINTSIHIREPQEDIILIRDALEHLNIVCTESYNSTAERRDQVKYKMEELKTKLK